MFRDVVYICADYSVRVQDGYFIFRWWRSYVPKDVSEDLSHSDTRLSVMLNGFELHVYNRSELYSKLEKTFGLKPSILTPVRVNEESIPIQDIIYKFFLSFFFIDGEHVIRRGSKDARGCIESGK